MIKTNGFQVGMNSKFTRNRSVTKIKAPNIPNMAMIHTSTNSSWFPNVYQKIENNPKLLIPNESEVNPRDPDLNNFVAMENYEKRPGIVNIYEQKQNNGIGSSTKKMSFSNFFQRGGEIQSKLIQDTTLAQNINPIASSQLQLQQNFRIKNVLGGR